MTITFFQSLKSSCYMQVGETDIQFVGKSGRDYQGWLYEKVEDYKKNIYKDNLSYSGD